MKENILSHTLAASPAAKPINALNDWNRKDLHALVAPAAISGGGGVILIDLHQDLILASI